MALELDELGNALVAQIEQGIEALAVEGSLLASALELNHLAGVGSDEIHVDLGVAVLGIIQVEQGVAVDNAHRDGSNLARERDALDLAGLDPHSKGVVQRHPGTGNARRTRAAIRLDHIAVDGNGVLAERLHVDDGTQAAADEALDLHGAALTLGVLALATLTGRCRQHGILCGYPTGLGALAPARHALLDGGGTKHARVAELSQARAVGMFHNTTGELDGAQLIGGTAVGAVDLHVLHRNILSAEEEGKSLDGNPTSISVRRYRHARCF